MATAAYEKVLDTALALPREEQLRLAEELKIDQQGPQVDAKRVSIMDLEGLGAEIWEGIDAQEYVNAERATWER
jgi:hypothetical protein